MTDRELMQPALEALESIAWPKGSTVFLTIAALRERLAQPEQEQGCACRWDGDTMVHRCEFHEAWATAIHEWAERAKSAERKLKEKPEQEPVAEMLAFDEYGPQLLWFRHWLNYSVGTKLYTAPQPRQWQGLTDEEIWKCLPPDPDNTEFARAIEQALREKNT